MNVQKVFLLLIKINYILFISKEVLKQADTVNATVDITSDRKTYNACLHGNNDALRETRRVQC